MYAWACSFRMSEFSEAERRDPVDDPEVDHLGHVSLGLGQRCRIRAETSEAVAIWMSSPRRNASRSLGSPET